MRQACVIVSVRVRLRLRVKVRVTPPVRQACVATDEPRTPA